MDGTTADSVPPSNASVADTAQIANDLALYRVMQTARYLDQLENDLTTRGEAFFHVSGAGHESTAALNRHLVEADWLHCHYRDKALMLARGLTPKDFFDSLLCNADSHSAGRQMSAHMSDPSRNILSIVGPVGNSALHAAGVASVIKPQPTNPIVLCGLGDGMSQQGEVLEAIAQAVRDTLPVLFMVQDNQYAISTTTNQKTFYDYPDGPADQFYGLPIHRLDGRNPMACDQAFESIVADMRSTRRPAIIVLSVERLANHTNADDQRVYRSQEEITAAQSSGDPLLKLANRLKACGVSEDDLETIRKEAYERVEQDERASQQIDDPIATAEAKRPLPENLTDPACEVRCQSNGGDEASYTMLEAIRATLDHHLSTDEAVSLFGEDIQDPKGDVFGVTRGLSDAYGTDRVANSPLSESTIMGFTVGQALAGRHPVAFLQFADFLPIAFNQIISELGSMYWRTDGQWQCPVIIMLACGGYRPGLGPFHAQTLESIAAHIPGVDVMMPSTATDAAGMLNAAFASKRPTLFFYPKVCLNDRDYATTTDVDRQLVNIGRAHQWTSGDDFTIVSYGSTMPLCHQATEALQAANVGVDLFDLRTISPWDQEAIIASVRRTGRLLVTHEDNHSCSVAAEVIATVTEAVETPLQARRVTRPDTHVPCNFPNQLEILPSFKRILSTAAEMLDLTLTWHRPEGEQVIDSALVPVEAPGSSPTDQAVTVVEWLIKPGDEVTPGQHIADLDADKAVFDLTAPTKGHVEALLVDPQTTVPVGTPILTIRPHTEAVIRRKRLTREDSGIPKLSQYHRPSSDQTNSPQTIVNQPSSQTPNAYQPVGLCGAVRTAKGSDCLTNEQLIKVFPDRTSEDIIKVTGIESRPKVAEGQNALTLATEAAESTLQANNLTIDQIDLLLCSTTTPMMTTPSMACLILDRLCAETDISHEIPSYDINAACSGYLYALANAFDYLQTRPDARVLIVTTEVLTPQVDPNDFNTAIIFGDAASGTVLCGANHMNNAAVQLHRPILSARGEDGTILKVPSRSEGYIHMNGRKVFGEAVRKMTGLLSQACDQAQIDLNDLRLVIPHQANGRIIETVRERGGFTSDQVINDVRHHGNTSSTTIPLCLEQIDWAAHEGQTIGLCAFGGGFTFGAATLQVL